MTVVSVTKAKKENHAESGCALMPVSELLLVSPEALLRDWCLYGMQVPNMGLKECCSWLREKSKLESIGFDEHTKLLTNSIV
ncbi:hypothetical protein CHS0354_025237 [Potamilus streckersoni]|uniref:Uncharacterized protein n=1 Tax=Potamilus streckersoni TaxID=2493646 RepID=A0AAE0RSH5_9BIVA|nr:hypothetical protein CHS0354_025237 [Potamilus streckersoni]